jgi:predicted nucleic acid-binding protein
LAWKGHTDESRELTDALLKSFVEIALDEPVVRSTIHIRRSHNVKLPDAIIAASALRLGLPLVTRNVQDFGRVTELQLINPFSPTGR